jgi:hypothetical protein
MNAPIMAICSEADNQIRNASHHGAFAFEEANQMIRYRAEKAVSVQNSKSHTSSTWKAVCVSFCKA